MNGPHTPLARFAAEHRARVERALESCLPERDINPSRLHEAMRYAVLGGGKRVRALLVYASGGLLGAEPKVLDTPACAVELIHAYSLVHDDLPAMDDDELRRGKPTCHRAFDEATAVLVGDALQSLAFQLLSDPDGTAIPAPQRLQMVHALAIAAGSRGMAGGQAMDVAAQGSELTLPELEDMHIHKTGALIRTSVRLGFLASPQPDAGSGQALDRYAKCIGLAFQIRDDVLDVEGETGALGKRQGADAARDKPTYPALLGLGQAKRMAAELHEEALRSLSEFDAAADPLRRIADFVVERLS